MTLGQLIWFKGEEYTVCSHPYTLHGKLFQDAIGPRRKTITVKADYEHDPDN